MIFKIQKELFDTILSQLSLSDLKSLGLTCKDGNSLCDEFIQVYNIKTQIGDICDCTYLINTYPHIINDCIALSSTDLSDLIEYLGYLRKLKPGKPICKTVYPLINVQFRKNSQKKIGLHGLIQKCKTKKQVKKMRTIDLFRNYPYIVNGCKTLSIYDLFHLINYLNYLKKLRSGCYEINFSDFLCLTKVGRWISTSVDERILKLVKRIKVDESAWFFEIYLYFNSHDKYKHVLQIESTIVDGNVSIYIDFYPKTYMFYTSDLYIIHSWAKIRMHYTNFYDKNKEAFEDFVKNLLKNFLEDLVDNGKRLIISQIDESQIRESFSEMNINISQEDIISIKDLMLKLIIYSVRRRVQLSTSGKESRIMIKHYSVVERNYIEHNYI